MEGEEMRNVFDDPVERTRDERFILLSTDSGSEEARIFAAYAEAPRVMVSADFESAARAKLGPFLARHSRR